jgi:hypothetical protein
MQQIFVRHERPAFSGMSTILPIRRISGTPSSFRFQKCRLGANKGNRKKIGQAFICLTEEIVGRVYGKELPVRKACMFLWKPARVYGPVNKNMIL